MFKKTLAALAISAASLSAANAATVSAPNIALALEGTIAATTYTITNTVTAGSAYVSNDVLIISITGGTVDPTSTPTITNSVPANTVSFIDIVGNDVRFRVDANGVAGTNVLTLNGIDILTAGATDASSIKVASQVVSTNPVIGSYDLGTAAKAATYGAQYGMTFTALDGAIDMAKGRAQFTVGPLSDDLVFTAADNGGANALTETKVTHTVTGNFSYLMDYDLVANGGNGNGAVSATELGNSVTVVDGADTTVLSVNAGLTEITGVQTLAVPGTIVASTWTFGVIGQTLGGSILAAQTFSASSVATQGAVNGTAVNANAPGAWTLGADTTRVPFMPFGSDYSQSVTVSNLFASAGEVTVDFYDAGTVTSVALPTLAAAKAVTDISQDIRDAAAANGITTHASFDVVVNVPDTNADVVAVYYHKATQDRVKTN